MTGLVCYGLGSVRLLDTPDGAARMVNNLLSLVGSLMLLQILVIVEYYHVTVMVALNASLQLRNVAAEVRIFAVQCLICAHE